MSPKRRALGTLKKADLLSIGRAFDLAVTAQMSVGELLDTVSGSKRATLDAILPTLSLGNLKAICGALDLPTAGNAKPALIGRIIEATGGTPPPLTGGDAAGNGGPMTGRSKKTTTSPPTQAWLMFPTLEAPPEPAAPSPAPTMRSLAGDDWSLTVAPEPRKPRLAWQGMWRKEVAVSVPTQVVEIVRPGRVINRGDDLELEARQVGERDVTTLPPNRLIWTNDNLVALQTLLDERDPQTRDYRYRGRVDLVYIDPPFMVNNDFRADNSIDIDLDEDEGVVAKKAPSLVEILAYKDTWRQGLDTFLTMLKRRLELLKELLAPTGAIFVHLDWHASHYVKVLMDEIFGYECFLNGITWKRGFSHNDLGQGAKHLGRVHDSILAYGGSGDPVINPVFLPHDASIVRDWYSQKDPDGRRFQYTSLLGPGGAAKGNPFYELLGHRKYWRYSKERAEELLAQGRIVQPSPGAVPRYKRYLDEMPGVPLQDVWIDVAPVNSQAHEALGYPTQKPLSLIERVVALASPPGGLVLDCFAGSGTVAEAAERLGRRWISIDNGKYAIHLSRKRLIILHGRPRSVAQSYEYEECEQCGNIERRERRARVRESYHVQPFTVENMGVYQRAEEWQDFHKQRSKYRDEMIKVFGGEPVAHSPLHHGTKGAQWIHVGPLDGPVSVGQVWNIAREAQRTTTKAVTILSADFDTLSASEKDEIKDKTGVSVTIRVIPASAIDEVRRRIERQRLDSDLPAESMAIPAFYASLSIVLVAQVFGRTVRVSLDRCEIDIESFILSQRPVLAPVTQGMSAAARKKAQAELDKWDARKKELDKWLAKASTWQKFVDFWSIDWDYGRRVSLEGKLIFETDWQSFRVRRGKGRIEPLVFSAELRYSGPGRYRIAARVTDVFGNDGIATVSAEVK